LCDPRRTVDRSRSYQRPAQQDQRTRTSSTPPNSDTPSSIPKFEFKPSTHLRKPPQLPPIKRSNTPSSAPNPTSAISDAKDRPTTTVKLRRTKSDPHLHLRTAPYKPPILRLRNPPPSPVSPPPASPSQRFYLKDGLLRLRSPPPVSPPPASPSKRFYLKDGILRQRSPPPVSPPPASPSQRFHLKDGLLRQHKRSDN
jgi:hypothetical protein